MENKSVKKIREKNELLKKILEKQPKNIETNVSISKLREKAFSMAGISSSLKDIQLDNPTGIKSSNVSKIEYIGAPNTDTAEEKSNEKDDEYENLRNWYLATDNSVRFIYSEPKMFENKGAVLKMKEYENFNFLSVNSKRIAENSKAREDFILNATPVINAWFQSMENENMNVLTPKQKLVIGAICYFYNFIDKLFEKDPKKRTEYISQIFTEFDFYFPTDITIIDTNNVLFETETIEIDPKWKQVLEPNVDDTIKTGLSNDEDTKINNEIKKIRDEQSKRYWGSKNDKNIYILSNRNMKNAEEKKKILLGEHYKYLITDRQLAISFYSDKYRMISKMKEMEAELNFLKLCVEDFNFRSELIKHLSEEISRIVDKYLELDLELDMEL